uniref:Disease resistance N-terminal domain-containing protein n=1 Tax=Oryza glumipatula TaxID=40148 RepID=A0A0D9YEA5_9ORYZ
MDTIFSAVLGDLFSRSISFVIDIYHHHHQGGVEENLQQLHRMLLRIKAVVEEADSRCITNQAMLLQLRMLRDVMFRGYYFVDNFRYRIFQAQAKDEVEQVKSHLKSWRKKSCKKMLGHLETIVSDTQEFVVLASSYPRITRQPYCSYVLLENCMFGRHAELERVIKFMLEHPLCGAKGIDVLPIIGPGKVGKSTLVEHVCRDERVRKCFSTIVFYGPDSIDNGDMVLLPDTRAIKYRNPASGEQSLAIIELVDEMDDETWRRILHSLRGDHITSVSKIIITSRSRKIATFGTTKALQLDFLPKEAFWYLFKTVAFGSTNPEEEPKLASICMEIADLVNGSFMESNVVGSILRSNLSAQFWHNFLKRLKYFTDRHFRLLGEHPRDSYKSNRGRTYIWMHKNYYGDGDAATYNLYHANSAGLNNLPMIRMSDMLIGNVKPQKKCEALEWQSSIPPYYSYIVQYEILARQPLMLPKRKRSRALLEELRQRPCNAIQRQHVQQLPVARLLYKLHACPDYTLVPIITKILTMMDTFFSAVLGDLLSRSISFMIDRYEQQQQSVEEESRLQQLHRVLLRIEAIVEEADGRLITNRAMLQQLGMLREMMYRGYYFLDGFRYRIAQPHAQDEVGDLSPFSPLKRFCISTRDRKTTISEILEKKELQEMLGRLKTVVSDMQEFVVLVSGYPRMKRQLYCSYLLLENCMFGRQIEKERNINFLLAPHPLGDEKDIDVLPIIGPGRVGKSTLVEHVCRDERVREYFSTTVYYGPDSIGDGDLAPLTDTGVLKHRNRASSRQSLAIIELVDEMDDETWRRILQSLRSGDHVAPTVAFGSTNPEEEPKLASICMEIAAVLNGSFMGLNIVASILNSNLSAQFWYSLLKRLKFFTYRHIHLLGEHPRDLYNANSGRTYIWMHENYCGDSDLVTYNYYQVNSARLNGLQTVLTSRDILTGTVKPQAAKYEVLEWQSSIPPYNSYITQYEILAQQKLMLPPKRKRSGALSEELRLCISTRTWKILSQVLEKKELQKMLDHLQSIVSDMQEFVVLMSSYPRMSRQPYGSYFYPRMSRQPYGSYLLLENCMFGRQIEKERIINFLLEPHRPAGSKGIDVLPIIGPCRVGKTTLVEHVCHDEMVRKCFSKILMYGADSIECGELVPLTEIGVIKHRNPASTGQSLLIIELVNDMDNETWTRILHRLRGDHSTPVGKIIITSRSNKVATFGTTEALQLDFLPEEEFWYFFKTMVFGSANPEEEPELAAICMEIAALMNRSFMGTYIIGEHPTETYKRISGHTCVWTPENRCVTEATYALTYTLYQASSEDLNDQPMVLASDVLVGNVQLQGKVDVLQWRSKIPPYYCYMAHFEVLARPLHMPLKRKRSRLMVTASGPAMAAGEIFRRRASTVLWQSFLPHKLAGRAARARPRIHATAARAAPVLGDLLGRSISFIVDSYYQQHQGVEENLQKLHHVLLRIQAIVEEASSRHITNQAMLLQLTMLSNMMYRGYYFLDNFRYRIVRPHAQDELGDHSLGMSPFSPFKRLCFSTRTRKIVSEVLERKELQKMLGHLETIVSDMQEFVLPSYGSPALLQLLVARKLHVWPPSRTREGNQLLAKKPCRPGAEGCDVLPIIGPGRVGKSTLVEHVCRDERVRKYFSTIVFYSPDGIGGEYHALLTDTVVIKHQNPSSTEQSLLVIELSNDMDDETWRRILHRLRNHITPVSKIIITSRSKNIATFGTTEALQLDFLPKEAFWYFFKTIAFGSSNPEEEPKLAAVCMEIAVLMNGSFIGAHVIGGILRSNLSGQFWYTFLEYYRYFTGWYIHLQGEHQSDMFKKRSGLTYIWSYKNWSAVTATFHLYQISSANLNDLPVIRTSELLTRDIKLEGKFDALEWRSSVPPYYSYMVHHEYGTGNNHDVITAIESISFTIDRYYRQHQGVEENLRKLHRMLLRIQAIVEEAHGRQITNQAMLLQLRMVRAVMYRGYYFLDNFRYRTVQAHAQDEVGDRSLGLSPFSQFKRFCFSTRTRKIASEVLDQKELQKMLGHLENIVSDMQEFVAFVSCYPRMSRQPYCSYLLLENCMFGRQIEQEKIINFLLEPNHPSAKGINVLPIIGPGRVGKSTLVEHVCHDERVRKYFSMIVLCSADSIGGGFLTDTGLIKHRNPTSTGQSLVIIELADDDMDDRTWTRILHNLRGEHITPVSKIILTSRSDKIRAFGTTEALHLDFLPKEAFWYFFKTIAFGSRNPEEEPKLASICMEIATLVKGSFMATHVIGGILRSNLSAQFWCRFLKCFRHYTDMHISVLGEHPSDAYTKTSGLTYIWTSRNMSVVAATYSLHQASSAQLADLSPILSNDVLTGDVEPPEKFDALEWRSSIPPYYNYISHYEILAQPPDMLPKRKRSRSLSEGLV